MPRDRLVEIGPAIGLLPAVLSPLPGNVQGVSRVIGEFNRTHRATFPQREPSPAGQALHVFDETGCLGVQVPLVRQAGSAAGGLEVAGTRSLVIPRHLEHVGANGMEAVPGREPLVVRQLSKQTEPGARAAGHGGGDGVVQRDDRVVGRLQEQFIEGQDLLPVGVLGGRCLVVYCGDGCLQLVRPGQATRESSRDQLGTLRRCLASHGASGGWFDNSMVRMPPPSAARA
jgi:hypothetical protein